MAQSGAGKKGALVCNMEKVCVYVHIHKSAWACKPVCLCMHMCAY